MIPDTLLNIKIMIYGAVITFFLGILRWLIPALKRTKNTNARYVMRLLIFTMIYLAVKNVLRFVLDMVNIGEQGVNENFYHNFAQLLEMLAVFIMGMSLVALVRLSPPRKTEVFNMLAPLALSIGFYFFTRDMVAYYIAMCYVIAFSAMVIVVVHIYAFRYQKLLNETYANTQSRGVTWVVTILYVLVVLLIAWLVLSTFLPHQLGHIVYFPLSIIPWSFYSFRLMRQNFDVDVMRDIVEEEERKELRGIVDEDEDDENVLKKWQEAEFGEAVMRFCTDVANFTNTDLSIADVARAVGTNRTYVSRWCKDQGKDFSSFIADIRLDYAERMLAVKDFSISEVVEKSGFTSPRSFRNVFEARHNCTPTEYRARLNLEQ